MPEWIAGSVYVPYGPNATMEDGRIPTDMTLAVGTTLDTAEVTGLLRRVAAPQAATWRSATCRTMASVVADAVAAPAATASLLVTMAGLALVLGSIGVYGVLSFLVSRRTRDLGIRIALGAQRRDMFWLVIKEGGMLCGAGVVLGFAGALAATRLMSSELYGISPTDPADLRRRRHRGLARHDDGVLRADPPRDGRGSAHCVERPMSTTAVPSAKCQVLSGVRSDQ